MWSDIANKVLTSIPSVVSPNSCDYTPIVFGVCVAASIIWIGSGKTASNIWWLLALFLLGIQFWGEIPVGIR